MTSNSKLQAQLHGLYVITDREIALRVKQPIEILVEQAIIGGARIIQYRNKISPYTVRQQEAKQLAQLCRAYQVIFLINDDVDLAIDVDADGVHLGQSDTSLPVARQRLGEEKIIGITCHNDLEAALSAQHAGANYVAFGRFFPSHSKPTATPASMKTLAEAKRQLHIPVCAIGGITHNNAKHLLEHGVDMLAVIHAVLAAEDIRQAASKFAQLFK